AGVLPLHAGQRDDGRHLGRPVAGVAVGHEGAVGVADDVDPRRVGRVLRRDLGDDGVEVGDVVDAGVEEVAAGIGGVPEAPAEPVPGAVGIGQQEPGLVGLGGEPEVAGLLGAVGAVAVEQHHQRDGVAPVVAGGDLEAVGPVGGGAGGL